MENCRDWTDVECLECGVSGRSERLLRGGAMRKETSSIKPQASGKLQIPSFKNQSRRVAGSRLEALQLSLGVSPKLEVCSLKLLCSTLFLVLCFSSSASPGWVTFGNNNSSRIIDGTTGLPVATTNGVKAALY